MDADGRRGLKRSREDYRQGRSSRGDDPHRDISRDANSPDRRPDRRSGDDHRHDRRSGDDHRHDRRSGDDYPHRDRQSSEERHHDRRYSSQASDEEERKSLGGGRHRSSYGHRDRHCTRYDNNRSSSQGSDGEERKSLDGARHRSSDGRRHRDHSSDDRRHRHRTPNDDRNSSGQDLDGGRILKEKNNEGGTGGDCGHKEEELSSPSQPKPSLLVATDSEENATQCLVLGNVFDSVTTQSRDLVLSDVFGPSVKKRDHEYFWKIEDSVQMRCAEFGQIEHVHAHENGSVYLRFSTTRIAIKAHKSLHGSLFEGRRIAATFMDKDLYLRKFPIKQRQ